MLWRVQWEDLQFESPNKYHKRAGSRLTLSQVEALLFFPPPNMSVYLIGCLLVVEANPGSPVKTL